MTPLRAADRRQAGERRSPARPVAWTVALVVAVVTSACGSDDATPSPPPVSFSALPSATPSATITAPTMPPAERTTAGAEAFVDYFWKLYDYMYVTGDVVPFLEAGTPDCTFCRESSTAIEKIYSSGARVEGGRTRLRSSVAAPVDLEVTNFTVVAITYEQDAGRIVGADDSVSPIPREGPVGGQVRVEWNEGSWHVAIVAKRDE